MSYLKGYFIFDVLSTVPLLWNEKFRLWPLKCLKFIHLDRLTLPLEVLLGIALQKYSKKRQSDLQRFMVLIIMVIYVSHVMACIWIYLGMQQKCNTYPDPYDPTNSDMDHNVHDDGDSCILSWIYANEFDHGEN